ncbi:MAG: hypothetical protein FWE72_03370 [Spirochaetaceae bacterium]|nr:hypothetical protein [Spirochaetaceae bacterium]
MLTITSIGEIPSDGFPIAVLDTTTAAALGTEQFVILLTHMSKLKIKLKSFFIFITF